MYPTATASVSAPSVGRFWNDLSARQPQLSGAAALALLATIPCIMAMLVDARTVNDINVWIKPAKFCVSFVLYYATLAWAFGYVPRAAQSTPAGRFVIYGALTAGLYEMVWLLLAAAQGVPSHFNFSTPVWIAAYVFAGACSVVLIAAIFVQGLMIARQRAVRIAPALRWALVAGASSAFVCTLVIAGFLSASKGHWVGGAASDAAGLPLLGWSRTGGDLRVAHFWSLHAQQIIPAFGYLLVRNGHPRASRIVLILALGYVSLIVFTFVQALLGKPFLG